MAQPLVVAVAQPRCLPYEVAANALAHAAVVRAAGARVVLFPELSLTGYELDAPVVAVDGAGADVAYHKVYLGDTELARFSPGVEPAVIDVDGWRLGLAICKDLGVAEHAARTAALGMDAYLAGTVKLARERALQEERAHRVATGHQVWVAVASFAGSTGGGFDDTAGWSSIWRPDGVVVAKAGSEIGAIVPATLG